MKLKVIQTVEYEVDCEKAEVMVKILEILQREIIKDLSIDNNGTGIAEVTRKGITHVKIEKPGGEDG